jgi:hypothetical protein
MSDIPSQAGRPVTVGEPRSMTGVAAQRVAHDLILPGELDIRLALGVGKKTVEGAHPACVTGDAEADHHHAPSLRALLVKLVELVARRRPERRTLCDVTPTARARS